jgi:hypothetical protein
MTLVSVSSEPGVVFLVLTLGTVRRHLLLLLVFSSSTSCTLGVLHPTLVRPHG